MTKNRAESKDVIISGAPAIEEFMKRSYVDLMDLRASYQFPIKKRNGVPSLSMLDLEAWKTEYGISPEIPAYKITTAMLHNAHIHKQIENVEDKTLTGIEEICNFLWRSPDEIIRFSKASEDSPILKEGRTYRVRSTKSLLLWLKKMGLRQHGDYTPVARLKPWDMAGLR